MTWQLSTGLAKSHFKFGAFAMDEIAEHAPAPSVSEWFPLAPADCKKQANVFFECFSTHGAQPADISDAEAGTRGLAKCLGEMSTYDKCMAAWRKRTPRKTLYRVQEEYRTN
jgi:hypothetical protein